MVLFIVFCVLKCRDVIYEKGALHLVLLDSASYPFQSCRGAITRITQSLFNKKCYDLSLICKSFMMILQFSTHTTAGRQNGKTT